VPSLAILFSAVSVLSCGQTDRQTDRQTHRITDADDRYTDAITVGVSNEMQVSGTWMHPGGLAFVGLLKDSVCM